MASTILLKNPKTGLMKKGYYGYSWTTFFFGPWPALFRGDFIAFGIYLGACILLTLIAGPFVILFSLTGGIIWASVYNRYYTLKLLSKGYVMTGSEMTQRKAAKALGIDYDILKANEST